MANIQDIDKEPIDATLRELDCVVIDGMTYPLKDATARADLATLQSDLFGIIEEVDGLKPIDLEDYIVAGKKLPTLQAAFTYQGKLVEGKTVYIEEEAPDIGSTGYYHVFGCSHDRELGHYDEYNWFFVFNTNLSFVKVIDISAEDEVPAFIEEAFHVNMDWRVKTLERAHLDLNDYAEKGKQLPTLNATFVYKAKLVEGKTVYVYEEDGWQNAYYHVFGCSHDKELNAYDEYHCFFVYDKQRNFVAEYNMEHSMTILPKFIKEAFLYGVSQRVETLEGLVPGISTNAETAARDANQASAAAERVAALFEESIRTMQNLPDGQAVSALVAQMSASLDNVVEVLREKGEITDANAVAIERMRGDILANANAIVADRGHLVQLARTALTYDVVEEAAYDPEWDGQMIARMRRNIENLTAICRSQDEQLTSAIRMIVEQKQRIDNLPPSLTFDIEQTNI